MAEVSSSTYSSKDVLFFRRSTDRSANKASFKKFKELIKRAKYTIDIAMYEIHGELVQKILCNTRMKRWKDIEIRLIISQHGMDKLTEEYPDDLQKLKDTPNIMIRDQRSHDGEVLHHKFAIINDKLVLGGSLNWTFAALNCNDETVLVIKDKKRVKAFIIEFEKLWEKYKDNKIPGSIESTVTNLCYFFHKSMELNGYTVVKELLDSANSIDIAIYDFSCVGLINDFLTGTLTNKTIRLLYGAISKKDKNGQLVLAEEERKMKERFGQNIRKSKGRGTLHHKFVILDGETVLNGSLNWTEYALNNNHENLVVINNHDTVKNFKKEFDYLWYINRP